MIGIGIDAVDIARFRALLGRRAAVADRLFSSGELTYARGFNDPIPRLAVRFAAKEATMKALGVGLGSFAFHDVEVVSAPSGKPYLDIRGAAAELAMGRHIARWEVSLTHTETMAQAVVVAL